MAELQRVRSDELQIGDVVVEYRRVKGKNKEIRTKIKSIRRGGHTPVPRVTTDKNGDREITEPLQVNPVPERLIEASKVIVNENSVFDRTGSVLVDRG